MNKFKTGDRFEDQKYGHIYTLKQCLSSKFDFKISTKQGNKLNSVTYVKTQEIENAINTGKLKQL